MIPNKIIYPAMLITVGFAMVSPELGIKMSLVGGAVLAGQEEEELIPKGRSILHQSKPTLRGEIMSTVLPGGQQWLLWLERGRKASHLCVL